MSSAGSADSPHIEVEGDDYDLDVYVDGDRADRVDGGWGGVTVESPQKDDFLEVNVWWDDSSVSVTATRLYAEGRDEVTATFTDETEDGKEWETEDGTTIEIREVR